jgi:hypothetical protein
VRELTDGRARGLFCIFRKRKSSIKSSFTEVTFGTFTLHQRRARSHADKKASYEHCGEPNGSGTRLAVAHGNGYQLETDSLGSDLLLRRMKNNEVIRPASANRNTLKALQEHGLIAPAKSDDPLTIVWRANNKRAKKKR